VDYQIQAGDRVIYSGQRGYPLDYDKAEMAGLIYDNTYYVAAVRYSGGSREETSTEIALIGHPGWHHVRVFTPDVAAQETPCVCLQRVNDPQDSRVVDIDTIFPALDDTTEFYVEATIQTVVRATDAYGARLAVMEAIREGVFTYAKADPIHGAVIDSVEEIDLDA
jgi:hypothetical protein